MPGRSIYESQHNEKAHVVPNQKNFKERRHSVIYVPIENGSITLEAQALAGEGGGDNAVRVFGNQSANLKIVVKSPTDKRLSSESDEEYTPQLWRRILPGLQQEYKCFKLFYPSLCETLDKFFPDKIYELNDDTYRSILPFVPGKNLDQYILENINYKEELASLLYNVILEWKRVSDNFGYMHLDFHSGNVLIDTNANLKVYLIDFEHGVFSSEKIEQKMSESVDLLLNDLIEKMYKNRTSPSECIAFLCELKKKNSNEILDFLKGASSISTPSLKEESLKPIDEVQDNSRTVINSISREVTNCSELNKEDSSIDVKKNNKYRPDFFSSKGKESQNSSFSSPTMGF